MIYRLRYTLAARADIKGPYAFLAQQGVFAAEKAIDIIIRSMEGLGEFPFTERKAKGNNSFLRELLIPFGSAGYVALYEIEDDKTVSILAIRHQREDDYH